MIVAFDLDETLYPEVEYVESGFRAVARHLSAQLGVSAVEAYKVMQRSLASRGRGCQFDDVLRHHDRHSKRLVAELLQVYRRHDPDLSLPAVSAQTLRQLADRALYLVTDGNHRVQARKVEALGIGGYFRHCYFTNRYGRDAAKPSTRVFELMLARESATSDRLVYIGDNPAKDFVGVRRLGGRTIRVHTGAYADAVARPGYGADLSVATLAEVPALVAALDQRQALTPSERG